MAGGKPILNKTGAVPAKTELSETISAALKKRGFKFVGPGDCVCVDAGDGDRQRSCGRLLPAEEHEMKLSMNQRAPRIVVVKFQSFLHPATILQQLT